MDRNVILAFLISSVAVFGGVVVVASDSFASEFVVHDPTGDIGNGYTLVAGTVVDFSITELADNADISVTIDGVSYENVVGAVVSSDFSVVLYDVPVLSSAGLDQNAIVKSIVVQENSIVFDVDYITDSWEFISSDQLTFSYCDVVLFLAYDGYQLTPVFDSDVPAFASEVWVRCPFVGSDTPIILGDSSLLLLSLFASGSVSNPVFVYPSLVGDDLSAEILYDALDSGYYNVRGFVLTPSDPEASGFVPLSVSVVPYVPQTYFDEFVASIGDADTSDSDDPFDLEASPTIDFEIFGISEIGGIPVAYIIGGLVVLVFILAIASGVRRR